ncbi:MAG: phosphotransferase family protein [Sporichthyaceae bacterium]
MSAPPDADVEARIAAMRTRYPTERSNAAVLDAKLRRRGNVTHAARTLSDVAAQLEKFLSTVLAEPFSVSGLGQLAGGASKEQFAFDLEYTPAGGAGAGQARRERMVLRLNPPANVIAAHGEREYQALRALHGIIPVPAAHWVITDYAHFGEPGLICEFVAGVAAPTKGNAGPTGIGTAYGELAPTLGPQFIDHLATLHALDPGRLDLSSFDVPAPGTTEAVDWRLALWDRVWAEDTFEPHPALTLTREWLWANRPVVDRVSLLHGDYRNGNFLFDEDAGQITALLDWEMAYLGDRHHDLGYLMMAGWGHEDSSGNYLCAGLLEREAIIARYEQASGLSVDPVRLEYYTVLNLYWAAVACCSTAIRNMHEGMTHLDVMMPFVSGLGAMFLHELTKFHATQIGAHA